MPSCQFRISQPVQRFPLHCVSSRLVKRIAASRIDTVANGHYVTYINRSVGPDEIIESGGTVVVRGNVDHDAHIQAAGDVMVWGRLSGDVHAGCQGNSNASITALELRGAHLMIARVRNLAAARITVPGPHSAVVTQVGSRRVLQLVPMGAPHPPASTAGVAKSFTRWLQWYPAAAAALFTGAYALLAGLALLAAPKKVLGLLFNVQGVEAGWIRLGGVLFATFGMQYLGTALVDWRLAHSSSISNDGLPDMPFRPAAPHSKDSNGISNVSTTTDSGTSSTRSTPGHQIDMQGGQQMHSSAAAAGMPAASTGQSWPAAPGGPQAPQSLEQPTLGIYDRPPSIQSSDSPPISGPTSSVEQHHHAELQYASWLYSSTGFYEASVWSRLVLAVLFCGLVVVGQCQPGLLLLALLNFFGALGMMNALKQQWCMHVMGDMPAAAEQS